MRSDALLIALAKGRLGAIAIDRLHGTELELNADAISRRALCVPTATERIEVLLVKGADLPRYVAAGVAVLGVVGSDTLDECDVDLLELSDLGFGACRLSLCAPAGRGWSELRRKPHLRIASKFPRATETFLAREGVVAELVELVSSVELAPLVGLADAIVDLVQTGGTLEAHGLCEVATLGRVSARLVASRAAYLSSPDAIRSIADQLEQHLKQQ